MKSTKKALFASVFSMLLCFVMLIGTTFAWFTDTVTSGSNKIKSGNLKIDLVHVGGSESGGDVSINENPEHKIFDYDLWEPGYTQVATLKVVNDGSLALKFRLDILTKNADKVEGNKTLADVIDVYVHENKDGEKFDTNGKKFVDLTDWSNAGTLSSLISDPDGAAYGILLPADKSDGKNPAGSVTMDIALHMREEAGNEYQSKSLGDVSIVLNATQYTYENDSFDDQYDKNSGYLLTVSDFVTRDDGNYQLKLNDGLVLGEDLTLSDKFILLTGNGTLDLGGHNIIFPEKNGGPLYMNGANITIKGNGIIKNSADELSTIASYVYNNSNVTIEGGTIYNLYVQSGSTVTIKAGANLVNCVNVNNVEKAGDKKPDSKVIIENGEAVRNAYFQYIDVHGVDGVGIPLIELSDEVAANYEWVDMVSDLGQWAGHWPLQLVKKS